MARDPFEARAFRAIEVEGLSSDAGGVADAAFETGGVASGSVVRVAVALADFATGEWGTGEMGTAEFGG